MSRSATILAVGLVVVVGACSTDGRDLKPPTEPLPAATTTTISAPTSTVAMTPATSEAIVTLPAEPSTIEIEQLYSPANATAEMSGFGADLSDAVTVDDEPGDVLSFEAAADGGFVLQVWIEEEGAHTVCVADTCGRVYTLAPDAESPEEVVAKIDEAIPIAAEYVDLDEQFPGWTIEIGGALSGTGGTADVVTKTITVYRNRGRSVDDYVRTILHEAGHVADFELLDDAERIEYLGIRGIDTGTPWRDEQLHRLDAWGMQPSEDFAEVMVAIWSDGRWQPRTTDLAPIPDDSQLELVRELTAP